MAQFQAIKYLPGDVYVTFAFNFNKARHHTAALDPFNRMTTGLV